MQFTELSSCLTLDKVKWSEVRVAQLCLILCDPMDYTVHGILQARILEWVTFPFRGSSHPGDQTQVSHIAGGFFTSWATKGNKKGVELPVFLLAGVSLFVSPFGASWIENLDQDNGPGSKSNQNKSFPSIYYLWSTRRAIWSSWRHGLTCKVPRVDKKSCRRRETYLWAYLLVIIEMNSELEAEGYRCFRSEDNVKDRILIDRMGVNGVWPSDCQAPLIWTETCFKEKKGVRMGKGKDYRGPSCRVPWTPDKWVWTWFLECQGLLKGPGSAEQHQRMVL